MKIHHINCGAMQPYGGGLMDGQTPGLAPANLTCHCLVLETPAGLVLVDTGTVSTDPATDARILSPLFQWMDRPRLNPAEAAANQLQSLGHKPEDVTHIVMTHLDFDHAAGLRDFPRATIHLSAAEAHAARHPNGPIARNRYIPGQWGDIGRWRRHETFTTPWFGLESAEILPGIELVPLPGHTNGHCGVAIRKEDNTWLLHAADAIFVRRELDPTHPRTPTGARAYQWLMQTSQTNRRRSLKHLRTIARESPNQVEIICTHDPAGFPPKT